MLAKLLEIVFLALICINYLILDIEVSFKVLFLFNTLVSGLRSLEAHLFVMLCMHYLFNNKLLFIHLLIYNLFIKEHVLYNMFIREHILYNIFIRVYATAHDYKRICDYIKC